MSPIKSVQYLVTILAATLCGCATTPEPKALETEIISDPPGARIEIDGEYKGDTPIKVKLRQRSGLIVGTVVIRALPGQVGGIVSSKQLVGPVVPLTGGADKVPAKLFFDLRSGPSSPASNITFSETPKPQTQHASRLKSSGTGFAITDDGYILTSLHVIRDATEIKVKKGSKIWPAELIKKDLHNDIALLKASGEFKAIPLGESTQSKLGDQVFTIGFPSPEFQGFEPKLTDGRISSLTGYQDDSAHFQISVPVQPGNSGGPLMTSEGRVVGLIEAKLSERTYFYTGSLPQNVNYAVKSSYVRLMLNDVADLSKKLKPAALSAKASFDDAVKQTQEATVIILAYD